MPWKRGQRPAAKTKPPAPAERASALKKKSAAKAAQVTARRQRIAAQRITGATVPEIARTEQLSRNTVANELAAPQTQQIIVDLVAAQRPVIDRLFGAVLGVIEQALGAEQVSLTKDGEVISIGPDHYARLTAAKRLLEVLTAGRPIAKPAGEGNEAPVTWDRVMMLIRESGVRL